MRLYKVCIVVVCLFSIHAALAAATDGCPIQADNAEKTPLDNILKHLQQNAAELVSCTSKIEYLFIQDPDLLDSHTLRTGTLYYLKTDDRSQVKIRFDTLKQDDFDAEERKEIFLFDGVWLTKIDYALEQIDRLQQAPDDEPLDALDFISHHFPIVGFTGSEQFEGQFDVRLAEAKPEEAGLTHLILDVRPDSRYSKDYESIDFWIDNDLYLPRRVRALSTQGDIYDIRFLDIKTNVKLNKKAFTVETPAHFRKNVEPLKQESQTN